jgi:hypothetical protein
MKKFVSPHQRAAVNNKLPHYRTSRHRSPSLKTEVEKSNKQVQSKAVANNVSKQKGNSRCALEFVDNRPEAKMLKSLQLVIDKGNRGHMKENLSQFQPLQLKVGFEYEMGDIQTRRWKFSCFGGSWRPHPKGYVLKKMNGYNLTADEAGPNTSQLEVIIKEIDETDQNEVTNLIQNVIPHVEQTIDNIAQAANQNNQPVWTGGNRIQGLGGTSWNRYLSLAPDGSVIMGQLQMTGGISMANLPDIVSGRRANIYIGQLQTQVDYQKDALLANYKVQAMGPIWNEAIRTVNNNGTTGLLNLGQREQLAAIVALMVKIPVTARSNVRKPYPKAAAGGLLARTDFSKIMMLLPNPVKRVLTPVLMETLVIDTINQLINATVNAGDYVFPVNTNFALAVPQMARLSIGQWVRKVVPKPGKIWGYWQGKDLLTKKKYPGTKAQKEWLESMGGFGSKTDRGNKPIFEFRTLGGVFANSLVQKIGWLLQYMP